MNAVETRKEYLPDTMQDLSRFALVGREKLVAVRAEIRAIDKLGLAAEVRAQKLEEGQEIAEAVLDAEVKLGEIFGSMPKGNGGGNHGNQYTGGACFSAETNASLAPVGGTADYTKEIALAEIGYSRLQAFRYETLAANKDLVEQAKAEARENDDIVSRSLVLEKVKKQQREEKRSVPRSEPRAIEGEYQIIYADPPWQYDFSETESRAIENQYPTMELAGICSLDVPSAENAALFLWATAPKLQEALLVMSEWGFEYKTHAIWDKGKIGAGYWFRGQHELLLVGTKGKFSPPLPAFREASVYSEARGVHSKKPIHYYEMIEAAYPSCSKIEMFARGRREGWETYGNEVE